MLFSLSVLLMPCCQANPGPGVPPLAPDLTRSVEVDPKDPILAYAWDGRGEVPLHSCPGVLRIPFGELGRTADTVLYLPLDEGVDGAPFRGASELGVALEGSGCGWTDGRFGTALHLSKGARLELSEGFALPSDSLAVQFWVRPDEGVGASPLLEVPGLLRIATTADLRVEVSMPGMRNGRVVSEAPLRPAEWNSIGLAFSDKPQEQVRLVTNGAAIGQLFTAEPPQQAGVRLLLGGGERGSFSGAIDDLRIRHYGAASSELRPRVAAEAGPHRLELRRASGSEQLEIWAGVQPRSTASGDDLALGDLAHAALRGGRLRWVPGQWTEIRPERRPMARTAVPAVYIEHHRILVFGGETHDSDVPPMKNGADTWIFHTDTGQWEQVETQHAPSPRCHAEMAYSPDHGLVLLVGGFENDVVVDHVAKYEVRDDVWIYDVAARDWSQIRPKGYRPAVSANDALLYDPTERAFLQVTANGLRKWSVDENLWTYPPDPQLVDRSGAVGSGFDWLQSHLCGIDPRSGRMLVFGGERFHPERRLFNGTYLYDLASNVITDVGCSDAPSPRVRPGFAYDSKRGYFVLFGGAENQRSRLADLWRFLPRERVWERIDAANTPSARGGWYGMPYDPELDRFFLLCGRHDLSTFLDESWELELDDHAVGRATYVFDRETLPPGAQWRLDAKVPGDAAVLARFRSSDDGVHWSDWTGRFDDLTQRAGLVEVELTLRPGSHGEAPEVASLGFVA